MSVLFHQPARRLVLQVMAVIFIIFSYTLTQAAQVTLAWDANNPAPDGYRVFQRVAGETYNYTSPVWPQVGDNAQLTTCTIGNLADATNYYFVVRAFVSNDQSGDSNEISFRYEAPVPTTYTLSVTSGANGSISPNTMTVNAGGSQTFTISPQIHYHVVDVLVDGNSVGPVSSYTFSQVNADHSISASFAMDTFNISASTGAHGSISPSGTVAATYGSSMTYTMSAASGYNLADVLVDGTSVGTVASYTFNNISAAHTISASFTVNTYTITASAGTNGSITPGTATVNNGGSQTFSVTPAAHYHVADVAVDGTYVGPVSSYTFSQVNADHSISASFAMDTFNISASTGAHGSISPSGTVAVTYGSSRTYTISATAGYHLADVLVDNTSTGPITSYTFSNVTAAHTIAAVFEANGFTISSSAGTGGAISPSGQIAVAGGASQNFSLTVDAGYEIQSLAVDGVSLGVQSNYSFNNVQSNHTITASFILINQPPVADAGPDQVVDEAQMVTLSGANSRDADDGIAVFQWRQIQGVSVSLNTPGQEMSTFVAPDVDVAGQALVFELTVTDSEGATAKDTCIVNVTWVNQVPTASAGIDQTVTEGDVVSLSAAASADSDDGIAGYSWVQVQGPQVSLSDPQSASPRFTAPDVGPQGASLIFELTVTDAGGLQDTDSCKVTVTWDNREPVAEAGSDQEVAAGDQVTLDGSQSMDPDGSSLLYQWRQTDGPPVVLSDATAVSPVFSVPSEGCQGSLLQFELTVTDEGGLQGVDTCHVAVQASTTPPGPDPDIDTNPPVLSIDNPAQDYIRTRSFKINISGTAEDDRQVDRVVWVNDRGKSGVAVGTESWYIDGIRLHLWRNEITVSVYDTAGNVQSKTVTVDLRFWR